MTRLMAWMGAWMAWLGAALLCVPALWPAAYGRDEQWIKVRSPNFEVFTSAGERSGRDALRRFERVRAFFVQAMKLRAAGPPVRVILFRSHNEYVPYRPNEVAAAFYHPVHRRETIVMQNGADETFPSAVHEYTHLLV